MFQIPYATIESGHKKLYKQFLKDKNGEKVFCITSLLEKFSQNQEELKKCQKEKERLEKWKKKEASSEGRRKGTYPTPKTILAQESPQKM